MPPQQLDAAKANYLVARASVDGAVAAVAQAEAQVSLKQAAVEVAHTNLNYTVIHSPIDGTVVARNVDVGQTVAAWLIDGMDMRDFLLGEADGSGRDAVCGIAEAMP